MLWQREGLLISMAVVKGRVVGAKEDNAPVNALFLVRLLCLVFSSVPLSCLFLFLFIDKEGNPSAALCMHR